MTLWIVLAVLAQFVNAIVALVDKYIVTDEKILPRPFVYAFYVSVLSASAIIVYVFSFVPSPIPGLAFPDVRNIQAPTLEVLGLSLLTAYTFFFALVSMFTALRKADASDVVPVIGAVSAIGSFGLGYLFLGTKLSPHFITGIFLLAIGTALVSRFRFKWQVALSCIHAGVFFALHFVTIKGLFNVTSFDDGFFWSRVGFVVFGVSLLLVPSYIEKIFAQTRATGKRAGMFVIGNKVLAGIAALLVLKATELGDVSAVQALGGLQFLFILLIGILIGRKTPFSCGENGCGIKEILQKSAFVAIISLGFLMLFV